MILHVPHASRLIPGHLRGMFVLSDSELERELLLMTDAYTDELFRLPGATVVRAAVSRLVVDVERFEDDEMEPMSKVGMGKVTARTSSGLPLKRPLRGREIQSLVDAYYRPHHLALESAVEDELRREGRALIVDCHSFPSRPLPCDQDQREPRPDACIGTDEYHTPEAMCRFLVEKLERQGLTVKINQPYSGTIVPMKHYSREPRVRSVMIELNRALYMDEATGEKTAGSNRTVNIARGVLKDLAELESIRQGA